MVDYVNTSIPVSDVAALVRAHTDSMLAASSSAVSSAGAAAASAISSVNSATSSVIGAASSLTSAIPNVSSLGSSALSASSFSASLGASALLNAGISTPATTAANLIASVQNDQLGLGISDIGLAPPTFYTGLKDTLAAVDVYTASTAAAPVNNTDPLPSFNLDSILGMVNSGLSSVNSLISDYAKLKALPLNPASILNGVLSISPQLRNAFNSLPDGLKKAITATAQLTSSSNPLATLIRIGGGGVTSLVTNSSLQEISATINLISSITGTSFSPVVKDFSGTLTLLDNIQNVASTLKIPGTYKALVSSGMVASEPRIIGSLTTTASKAAVSSGSLSQLTEVAGASPRKITTLYPNIVKDFTSNYTADPTHTNPNTTSTRLVSTLSLVDPNWCVSSKAKTPTNNLGSLINGSKDMSALADSVSKSAKIAPVIVPSVTLTVPSAQLSTYTPPSGPGITVATVTNADGSKTYTVSYSPQVNVVAPSPTGGISAATPTVSAAYTPSAHTVASSVVDEENSTPTVLVTNQVLSDGTTQTVTEQANGTKVIVHTDQNGLVSTTTLNTSVTTAQMNQALSVSGDPLSATSTLVATNPMIAAKAISEIIKKELAYVKNSTTNALMSMSAAQALAHSFPYLGLSNLKDISV